MRLAGRQMKLAHPDIDPHDADPDVEKGIARESEGADIIVCGQALVGDVDVEVAEIDDVADIGGGAIEFFPRLAVRRLLVRRYLVDHGKIPFAGPNARHAPASHRARGAVNHIRAGGKSALPGRFPVRYVEARASGATLTSTGWHPHEDHSD